MTTHLDGYGMSIEFDGTTIRLIAGKVQAKIWKRSVVEFPVSAVAHIEYRGANALVNGRMLFRTVEPANTYASGPGGFVPDNSLIVQWRRKDDAAFGKLYDELAARVTPKESLASPAEKTHEPAAAAQQAEQVTESTTNVKAETKAAAAERKAEAKAATAERKARMKAEEKEHRRNNPLAMFGTAMVRGGRLEHNFVKYDLTDATAEASMGSPSSRSTFTRMGAGALIAGPAGFIVGAVAKKNTAKCYVTISLPEGVIVLDGDAKSYPAAVKFADAVNRSKR